MWILTPHGFLSAVVDTRFIDSASDGERVLKIRSRDRESINHFISWTKTELGIEHQFVDNVGTDYPFRSYAYVSVWSQYVAALATDIDYGNFKDELQRRRGRTWANVAHDIWDALWDVTPPDMVAREAAQRYSLLPLRLMPASRRRIRSVVTKYTPHDGGGTWGEPTDEDLRDIEALSLHDLTDAEWEALETREG